MLDSHVFNHLYALSKQLTPTLEMTTESAGEWWKNNFTLADDFDNNIHKLLVLAFQANNLSSVFNVGYQFALRSMFGSRAPEILQANTLSCLCVSESGGNSPKAILCHADEQGLSGVKTFVTCAPHVDHLFVLFDDCRSSSQEEIKNLRILSISDVKTQQGLVIQDGKPGKFLVEIDKGSVEFNRFDLNKAQVFPEDAHESYSKPFSLLEGLYIRLACAAYLFRLALALNLDRTIQSDLLAQIQLLAGLADNNSFDSHYQLVLDAQARQLVSLLPLIEKHLESQGESFKALWNRDKVIFFMDTPLRVKRLESAWQTIEEVCKV